MPALKVKHITKYTYNSPVVDCTNQIMLYPIEDGLQEVVNHAFTITGKPLIEEFIDFFGNRLGMFSLVAPHSELLIESRFEVITREVAVPLDDADPAAQWKELQTICEQFPYVDFLQKENFEKTAELQQTIDTIFDKNNTPYRNALAFSEYVYNNFKYVQGITSIETGVDEIWALKAGVCQDFAHMLLLFLRIISIPARYVSGYICPKDHEFRGEDATHAWAEAYIPFYGWLGLDPTNNCIASDRHIRLAVGRNFSDVTPVKGTYKGSSDHSLEVTVQVGDYKIDNVVLKPPVSYGYKTVNPVASVSTNSYRQYMEQMQQQQQQ